MGSKPSQPPTAELVRPRQDEQINVKHPLFRLAALINWAEIERTFAVSFTSGLGRAALLDRRRQHVVKIAEDILTGMDRPLATAIGQRLPRVFRSRTCASCARARSTA